MEGFPRSGNSFASVVFALAQPRQVRVAHHLHAPAQVLWAVRRGIPAIVLIREPENAVASLLIRHPFLTANQCFRSYIRFYKSLVPFRDRYVLAEFRDLIADPGEVISRVNERFNTQFALPANTKENIANCFQLLEEYDKQDFGARSITEETVARPSAMRKTLAEQKKQHFEEAVSHDLLNEARAIYLKLTQR